MSTPDPKVTGSPESIWLIYGEIDTDTAHDECHEIGWCDEPLDAADVRYVRGDVADRQAADAEALRRKRDELREQAAFVERHLGVIGGVLGSPGPIEIDDIAARLHLLIAERDAARAELAQARDALRSAERSYSGMCYGDDKAGGPSDYTRGWGDCLRAVKPCRCGPDGCSDRVSCPGG